MTAKLAVDAVRNAVDGRADLYSVGVLMYEMLTGSPVFTADSAVAVGLAHVRERPPHLVLPGLDEEVLQAWDELLQRLLAKDPELRPQASQEVVEELKRLEEMGGDVERVEPTAVTVAVGVNDLGTSIGAITGEDQRIGAGTGMDLIVAHGGVIRVVTRPAGQFIVAVAAHQYGRVGALYWLGVSPHLPEVYEFAVVFRFVLCPDLFHRQDPFSQQSPPAAEPGTVIGHFLGVPTATYAEDKTSVGEAIQTGDLFCRHDGVPLCDQADTGP